MFIVNSRTINSQIYITKSDVQQKQQEVKFADNFMFGIPQRLLR